MLGTNSFDVEDPFEILADGRSELSGLYLVRGAGRTIESVVPEGIEHILIGTYRCVFLSQGDHPLAQVPMLSAAQLNGASVTLKLCPVSSILMAGVQNVLRQYGVFIRVLLRKETRNADAFLHDLGDTYVQWLERVDAEGNPLSNVDESEGAREIASNVTVHSFEHPLIADAYMLYMPSKLNAAQLAYLAEVRRVAQVATPQAREAALS